MKTLWHGRPVFTWRDAGKVWGVALFSHAMYHEVQNEAEVPSQK